MRERISAAASAVSEDPFLMVELLGGILTSIQVQPAGKPGEPRQADCQPGPRDAPAGVAAAHDA